VEQTHTVMTSSPKPRAYGLPSVPPDCEPVRTAVHALIGAGRSGPIVAREDVEEMRRLRQDGWTYTAIGDRFGVTRSAVKLRLDHA
jgi:hypothetical protein